MAELAVDKAHPERFYLPDGSPPPDATVTVAGEGAVITLPVHSSVLSPHSPTVREQLAKRRKGKGAADLSPAFTGASLEVSARLLRLLYHPGGREATAAELAREPAALLPGLLRLAHRLGAAPLEAALGDAMLATDAASLEQLVAFVAEMEARGLAQQWEGLKKLGEQLVASGALGAAPPAARAALLAPLGARARAALAALLGGAPPAGGERGGAAPVAGRATLTTEPPQVLYMEVKDFSSLEGAVPSPPFFGAGHWWQLAAHPRGMDVGEGTHLSLTLSCLGTVGLPLSMPFLFRCAIRHGKPVPVAAPAVACRCRSSRPAASCARAPRSLGLVDFVSLRRLRDPLFGHLVGDNLRLSVALEMV
eukprot:scaffold1.g5666.t1